MVGVAVGRMGLTLGRALRVALVVAYVLMVMAMAQALASCGDDEIDYMRGAPPHIELAR